MAQRRFSRHQNVRSRLKIKSKRPTTRLILGVAFITGSLFFLVSAAVVLWWSKDLPNPQNIASHRISESTKIYDRTGEHILYEIGDIHRTTITLDQMSRYIRQATIAAEDSQFYEHHGLDFKGIIRGVILKPLTGRRAQGGSTITQQLIKNALLSSERTIQRKAKEAVLALELEQRFSKDEILEMYLNDIPYGGQTYGIEAASKTFFNKSAADLSLAEASYLAALPQSPSYYSPYGSHFEDLKARQEYILDRMANLDMITEEQANSATNEEVSFQPRQESITAPHFVFYVKELLEEEYGERLIEQGGLDIITTLDLDLQKDAEEALKTQKDTLNSLGASNAALAAIDPRTGDILAMAGSIDYFDESIDGNVNVTIRHRSPGSSIKPFVYASAFTKGLTPDTILVDAETNFGQDYIPKNYDLSEHGPVSIRTALANSLNIPAVKALYLAGVKEATELARNMGMTSLTDPDRYGLSLVLGGGDVRLLDEVSAYGVFANDGTHYDHRAILKVSSKEETLIDVTDESPQGEQVLDPQIAREITDILSDNNARALTFGLSSSLQLGSRPVAAKTGTTQEYRDGWTMGYTPSLVAGVWVGNNDYTPMKDSSAGARTAAPVWNKFMRLALENQPIEQFVEPDPIENIPHAILRGELPEIKVKWEEETQTAYTIDCPVAVGETRTFKELHSILFYINRNNPLGDPPAEAENDSQFANWEEGVAKWRTKHNEENKDNPDEIQYTSSLPEPTCNLTNSDDIPKVTITEPNTTILHDSPVTVKAEVESNQSIQEVRFLLDGEEIARRTSEQPYTASFSFAQNFSGRKTLEILAITTEKLIGRAHRTFIINPDDSPPSVTFHTPKDGENLSSPNFPYTIKVTATDPSGIELVDVLYRKQGETSSHRIGQTSAVAATAPNRYEVTWSDPPGTGNFEIYLRVYDKTGNFVETNAHTVSIN